MEADEKIQAHVLSIWREGRGFFSGKGREGMLVLTNKNLCFIKKTEAPMKWWGAIRTRQIVRLLQSKDVMIESLYYTILLLQAYDVILPESDVMFRLAEQLGVMKDSDFTPENESQIIDVIQKAVKQLVNM